jgi:hypothetical protein
MSGVKRGTIGRCRLARKMEPELNVTISIPDVTGIPQQRCTTNNIRQEDRRPHQATILPLMEVSVKSGEGQATVGCGRLGRLAFRMANLLVLLTVTDSSSFVNE